MSRPHATSLQEPGFQLNYNLFPLEKEVATRNDGVARDSAGLRDDSLSLNSRAPVSMNLKNANQRQGCAASSFRMASSVSTKRFASDSQKTSGGRSLMTL